MDTSIASLQIISLGLGVQSVALYYMSSMGQLPRADYAIVADTGREKTATYHYLMLLQQWQRQHQGIPIIVREDRNLYKDLLNNTNSGGHRFSSIPAFTRNDDGSTGMLRRQCTGEYKIRVVEDAIRTLYGLRPGQRRPLTRVWKGITTDELERMDQPTSAWKVNTYPFTGYEFDRAGWRRLDWSSPMSRALVIGWYHRHGLQLPQKSACVFCPYQSDASWALMKQQAPADFAAAIAVDQAIRDGTAKGIRNPCYLHKSLQPLAQIHFSKDDDLWGGECSGNCHL